MGTLHNLPRHGPAKHAAPPKPQLQPLARLDVEQARQFLDGLDVRTAGADIPEAMFLLGRLAEHAQALLDVIDATVTL
ncbi:MAG TPA: hypothetical protein VIJ82_05555 [Streptosporangiaceae bacterium]